jgi:hypothetical protein
MLQIIVNYANKHNLRTLLRTIEHMGDTFDELAPHEQDAYEELYTEMMQFVQQQNS